MPTDSCLYRTKDGRVGEVTDIVGGSSFVADTENTRRETSSSRSVVREEHILDFKQF